MTFSINLRGFCRFPEGALGKMPSQATDIRSSATSRRVTRPLKVAPTKRDRRDCTFGDSLRKALPCYHACLANSRFIGCLVGSLLCGSFAFRLLADFRAVRVPELVCIPAKKDRLKTYPFLLVHLRGLEPRTH